MDQRAKGESYLRGLLMDKRLSVDHQGLQQFVTPSTWEYEAVRANVAR